MANKTGKVKGYIYRLFTRRKTTIIITSLSIRANRVTTSRLTTGKRGTTFMGISIAGRRSIGNLIGTTMSAFKGLSVVVTGTNVTRAVPVRGLSLRA